MGYFSIAILVKEFDPVQVELDEALDSFAAFQQSHRDFYWAIHIRSDLEILAAVHWTPSVPFVEGPSE
jgi:hypothetical protein